MHHYIVYSFDISDAKNISPAAAMKYVLNPVFKRHVMHHLYGSCPLTVDRKEY